jgi:hypothetical protein
MLRSIGPSRSRRPARHRLGAPGLVHCRAYPGVSCALDQKYQRSWRFQLRVPARRSWETLRRRAVSLRHALSMS